MMNTLNDWKEEEVKRKMKDLRDKGLNIRQALVANS